MAIEWNLLNVPNIGETFSNAYKQGQENRALSDYARAPDSMNALNALAPFKPDYVVQQKQAMAAAQAKKQEEMAARRAEVIGQAAQWADTPEKWDAAIDHLSQQFPDLAQFKGKFSPEARMSAIAAAGQMKDYFANQRAQQEAAAPLVGRPGDWIMDPKDPTKVLQRVPFAPHYGTVSEGQTAYRDNGPLTVDNFLPAIVKQESGGNYKAVNRESGALGAYQVMPATGASLAQKLGLPWRPDLMTADTPEARQYQDQIGRAAVKEAVDNSGGDPATAAAYYHGGSDRSKWGPRTQKYAREVAARVNGGAQVIAQGAPKPSKEWVTMTPEEVRKENLQPGVYQRGPNGEIKPVSGQAGGAGGKGSPQEQARGAQMALQAAGVTDKVDPVSELIKKSTNGWLQNAAASAWSGITGDATDGQEAIGRLKTIGNDMVLQAAGGSLGAQISNSDRDFMAQRFGDIGNPEVPVDVRLAAWDQVKKRLKAIAGQGAPAPAPRPTANPASRPTGNVIRYDANGNRIK